MSEYSVYKILLTSIFALGLVIFPVLWITPAPYGRHNRPGWGSQIKASLGWAIMESPAVIVFALCFALNNKKASILPLLFLIMWQTHYLHRTYVYPFLIRGRQKQMPVIIMVLALAFNAINGYLNGRYLYAFAPDYPPSWIGNPRFITGLVLFIVGFAINLHSDGVLRKLRRPSEKDYKIPYGGLFEHVSCANYFGEIVEWFGWAVATWSLSGLAFAFFTVSNLVPRAYKHHEWYVKEFPDYPRRRKAVIPFVF